MNAKVFNLVSGVNETRFIVQHESCECKCGLNESMCNLKQNWNRDECRCDCKELNDWGSSEKDYRTYDYERKKAHKIDEYLHTKTCSCKKHLIGKLVLGCEDEILNST